MDVRIALMDGLETKGAQDFAPLSPVTSFATVTLIAQRLPVVQIPEEIQVASMRHNVVYALSKHLSLVDLIRVYTPSVHLKKAT